MLSRRRTLVLGLAAATVPGFARAADPARANPMPEVLRTAIERDPTAPVLGNPKGDITLTEFFDYNCPFCKKMVGTVQKLIAADPGLRVVFREWPVFGEGSDFAARVSLASRNQGKYWQTHSALMAMKGRAEQATVMRVVRQLGLDEARLKADMNSDPVNEHIANSFELADHMSLAGTPTFIAGDEARFGDQTVADLQALVATARKTLG